MESPYRSATISELRTALRGGRVSAVELAEQTLRLLGSDGVGSAAVVELEEAGAIRAARRADRGRARLGPASPPLLGIPYGVKALIAARSAAVSRLTGAGAVLAAHLAVENGGVGWAHLAGVTAARDRPLALERIRTRDFGPNPHDRSRWAGGSSGGSAIAVAAGILPFALGTETSGSIAAPAAYCGITGVRPTAGSIPLRGLFPTTRTMDQIGVLARTIDDCALVLSAIAGPLARRSLRRGPRVGCASEDFAEAPRGVRRAFEEALVELGRIAARLVPTRLPDLPYDAMVATVMAAEGGDLYGPLIESPELDRWVLPRQAAGLRGALATPAHRYVRAMEDRAALRRAFAALFVDVDLIAAPTVDRTAPSIAELRARRAGGGRADPVAAGAASPVGAARLIAAGNLAGLPAVFLPCGVAADGMPVGIQLVGPARSEPLLIAVGARYQRATGHHERRPPA